MRCRLSRKALRACYELMRLTFYVKRNDRVGFSEKTILAARAFYNLIDAIGQELGVEADTTQKKLNRL